jgi:hypothetical protein
MMLVKGLVARQLEQCTLRRSVKGTSPSSLMQNGAPLSPGCIRTGLYLDPMAPALYDPRINVPGVSFSQTEPKKNAFSDFSSDLRKIGAFSCVL